MKKEVILILAETIGNTLSCKCAHFRTEFVRHMHKGRLLWEGAVGVFGLEGQAEGVEVCYAWEADAMVGETEAAIYLKRAEVDSPEAAVRIHILGECDAVALAGAADGVAV